jgi:WD repeat-containing protein 48
MQGMMRGVSTLSYNVGDDTDTQVNLGKWVLANLFRGLIKAEGETLHSQPQTESTRPPSITRSPAPRHLPIERPNQSPPHRQRAMSGTFTESNTVSLNIPGLVSPAARSAVLPDMESPLARSIPLSTSLSGSFQPFAASAGMRTGTLSAIPQSPTSASIAGASPGDILSRGDYFSPKRKADPSPDRSQPATTPGETKSSVPQTPGGSFMGKFKGFGKKKQAEAPVSTVVEAPPPPPEDTVSRSIAR